MKKSVLAFGVLLALGAVWTGSAWYTGKKAEAEYLNYIAEINKQLPYVQITDAHLKRGLFSSELQYRLSGKIEDFDINVPIEGELYHGPLPLNLLRHFDFTPAVFSATNQLVKNEETQAWFAHSNNKNPLFSVISLRYSGRLKSSTEIAANKMTFADVPINWSDIHIDSDTKLGKKGAIALTAKSIDFGTESKVITKVIINGLKLRSQLEQTDLPYISLGNVDFDMDEIQVIDREGHLKIKNQKVQYQMDLQDDLLSYALKTSNDGLYIDDLNLSNIELNAQLKHLPAGLVSKLFVAAKDINNEQELDTYAQALLFSQPQLYIEPLQLSNEKGKINAQLNVELAKVESETALQEKLQENIFNAFNKFAVQINADKGALAYMISGMEQLQGKSKQNADLIAENEVVQIIDKFKHSILLENGDQLGLSLTFEDNKLKLNGNEIPKEYIGFLLTLIMSK